MKHKCDICHNDIKIGHHAWCKECNKPHPICHDCYKEGIKNGTLVKSNRNIKDIPTEEQLNKWT